MYLARDAYKNRLNLFENKPNKDGLFWIDKGQHLILDENSYPEVTWENSPVKVELVKVQEKESEGIIKIREKLKETFKNSTI